MKAVTWLTEVPYVRGDVEWLRARCGGHPLWDKTRIVRYLARGHAFKAMPMIDRDLLGGGRRFGTGIATRTDGVWAWKSSVRYLFEKYDLALPAEFLEHVREQQFRMPPKATLEGRQFEVRREVVLQKVPYVRGVEEWLRARCGGRPLRDRKRVVAYMSRGRTLKIASMIERDLLDGGYLDEAFHVRTDGTWVWTSSTAYHVQKHALQLPAQFLAHVRGRRFRMPSAASLDGLRMTIPEDDSDY